MAAQEVCLVAMPYGNLQRPSMALGLLQAILDADDIKATVKHANLWFAENVGLRRYELCASESPVVFMAGEWTFAGAAFPDDPQREEKDAEFIRQAHEASNAGRSGSDSRAANALVRNLWALRAAATSFVDETARRVLATGARVVGCTSTFEQHVASLALLRRIRELDPGVVTMMGGANCETSMGEATHRCFPWVDYVVSGEADGIVAGLCRLALERGRDVRPQDLPAGVLGPCHRESGQSDGESGQSGGTARPRDLPRAIFSDLDSLPVPRFDEYFEALAASPLRSSVRPGLPVETSRGCWWGAVHQCTFCGLNGTGMGYRSKSAERVFAELNELQDRYGTGYFEVVDNILDLGYFKSLLPMLAADDRERHVFYEIKANTTRERVEDMVRAGITWVQPGIESLHSSVLKLMDKGIQGWQNIQLLKWSGELGMRLSWSVLWGFPGERDDWYADMAGWLPALEHLSPPAGLNRLRYDRYSVYHEQARRYGLILFPIGAMSLVYPVGPADLDRLAYFFATEPGAGPQRYLEIERNVISSHPGVNAAYKATREWQLEHMTRRSTLWMEDRNGVLGITDTRSCARVPRQELTGLARAVCLACDAAPRPDKLAGIVGRDFGLQASADDVDAVVRGLLADRLVLDIDGRLLCVALRNLPPEPTPPSDFPGGHVALEHAIGAIWGSTIPT